MRRLEAIYKAAQHSVGIAVDEAVWFEAKLLVERHRRLTEQLDETMAHIAKLCRQLPGYDLLLTIPGCGPYIAALSAGSGELDRKIGFLSEALPG